MLEITTEMIRNTISKMKGGKAAGPSGVIVEMIKAAGEPFVQELKVLFNVIVQ